MLYLSRVIFCMLGLSRWPCIIESANVWDKKVEEIAAVPAWVKKCFKQRSRVRESYHNLGNDYYKNKLCYVTRLLWEKNLCNLFGMMYYKQYTQGTLTLPLRCRVIDYLKIIPLYVMICHSSSLRPTSIALDSTTFMKIWWPMKQRTQLNNVNIFLLILTFSVPLHSSVPTTWIFTGNRLC